MKISLKNQNNNILLKKLIFSYIVATEAAHFVGNLLGL